MDTKQACPVCGKERTDTSDCGCGRCGFGSAYASFFAGERSREVWNDMVNRAKEKWQTSRRLAFAVSGSFVLGNYQAAYLELQTGRLWIAHDDGSVQFEESAVQVSFSERNCAVLYADGTVRVYGDHTYSQTDTAGWAGVISVTAGTRCIYGVTVVGEVLTAGIPADPSISSWKNIRKIVCGSGHLVGLTKDGRVMTADKPGMMRTETESWKDVISIAAARGCTACLHADGTVSFAGEKAGDLREAAVKEKETWKDIIAIALDNFFLYALTHTGSVLVAGNCTPMLDQGRSRISQWRGIAALSASQSAAGAIDTSGFLRLAGMSRVSSQRLEETWEREIRPIVCS